MGRGDGGDTVAGRTGQGSYVVPAPRGFASNSSVYRAARKRRRGGAVAAPGGKRTSLGGEGAGLRRPERGGAVGIWAEQRQCE